MKNKFQTNAEYREYRQRKQKRKHKSDYARHGNKKEAESKNENEKRGGVI